MARGVTVLARITDLVPWLLAGWLVVGCASSRGVSGAGGEPRHATLAEPAAAARASLERFLDAVSAHDFQVAYRLLAGPLRERYTPARLAEDYAALGNVAADKLARARLALESGLHIQGTQAELALSERSAVRLVLESEGWKIAALE